jgi:hypothetical protein
MKVKLSENLSYTIVIDKTKFHTHFDVIDYFKFVKLEKALPFFSKKDR